MSHRDEQTMLLYMLNINYNCSWEEVELEIGYKLGDYRYSILDSQTIISIAKMMWVLLHNKKGIKI